ncbi:TPA: shikimate kinase [Streptococcus suis]|uniref:Shikimate kinase n=1 Tax=Streptococcus suis TaxID=1307 RepID=A0A4T2GQ76_STRSU|nr:shikimate kinase [Streptococcus suis]MBM7269214.1 shikimate kinase [Streptococcus suis]TII01243.1 shikimate kinase [Streptococcus suis]HEL1586608.1 shikimate kinase [Streptococcus suis]HEL1587386.1 shikimate kinase [Streptococcus suis]
MPIVLLGFMGVGKTTTANLLNLPVYDMDQIIEERIGMSIADYFRLKGEAAFRQVETEVLKELLALSADCLVSTGGGVVKSEFNRQLLQKNKENNVLLTASFDVAYERISQDSQSQRPLFLENSKDDFETIYQERMSLYQGLADTVIDTDDLSPEHVARKILCK